MATTITTGKPACYAGGTSGASYVVGYESKQNRVVRYTFTTGSGGASNVSVLIPNYSKSDDTGSSTAPLRWYIGSSSTDHANAGADSTYNGTLTMTTSGGYYNFSGTASVVLTPNTTYYLWIFPGSTTYGWWWVASGGTATITVNTAAMSSMSVGNGTLGSPLTISITRHSDSFTHTLYYRYGSNSYTQFKSGVADSYDWTPDLSLASYAPSATSFQLTILCRTYNGSTAIGDVTSTITLTIPDTVRPSVSATITDPKGYQSTYGAYVQGQSGIKVVINETTAYGSSIVSRKITVGSISGTGTSLTVQPISASGSVTVSVSVTDARGRTAQSVLSCDVLAYTLPKASVSGQRCTSDGTADPAGAYIKVTYSGSYTSLNSKNTASATLYYRKSGASSWASQSVSLSGGTVIAADAAYAYELQYAVKDNFSTQKTQTFQVGSAYVGMSLAKNADGVIDAISIGGTAHAGGGFVCEMDATFNGAAQAYSVLTAKDRLRIYGDIMGQTFTGTSGSTGWARVCTLTVKRQYANAPMAFLITQRGKDFPSILSVRFANDSGTDPALGAITYAFGSLSAAINKSGTSTWDLYVQKSEAYDSIGVIGPLWSNYQAEGITVTYDTSNTHLSSLPDSATTATKTSL